MDNHAWGPVRYGPGTDEHEHGNKVRVSLEV